MPPPVPYSTFTLWLLSCSYMSVVIVLLRLATQSVEKSLRRAKAELTERKAAEKERDRAEQRRLGMESQLRQSQKMQALGTLAGGIAHDFNNILAVIESNAELGLADVPDGNPARRNLEEIAKCSARAKDIVKQILLFSRGREAERKIIPLTPVIEDALTLLRATLPSTIKVRTSYASDLPPVSADPSQVYEVIMNLGTNACHAMSTTGGVISVDVDRVSVDDSATSLSADLGPGDYIRITVRDTGTGMNKETLERIFEPFFTTKGHAGTGLGLSVVHGIVQGHKGAIMVQSEPGRGTSVQVYF